MSKAAASKESGPPKSPGLLSLIKADVRMQPGAQRSPGLHASELRSLCPVRTTVMNQAKLTCSTSEDAAAVQAAFALLKRDLDARRAEFSDGAQLEMDFGSAVHWIVQYRLGLVGKLWGVWKCPACLATTEEGWMPLLKRRGRHDVAESSGPAPCVRCWSNLSLPYPWEYVEPTIYIPTLDIVGHVDGDLRFVQKGVRHRMVLEIKSAHDAKAEGKMGELPTPEHLDQASIYAWAWDVEYICFLYVNKNRVSESWKELIVPVNPRAILDAIAKAQAVEGSRHTKELPLGARICQHIQDERSRKCPAAELCWGRRPEASVWD